MSTQTFRGITYTVVQSNSSVNGTNGADWIEVFGAENTVNTKGGNDVVLAGVNFLYIDEFDFFDGEAIFYSGRKDAGNYTIDVGAGNDYVVTGSGDDIVYLGQGNNIYDADFFGQNLPGGDDVIYAGSGEDAFFITGSGSKTIYSGSGTDRILIYDYSVFGEEHNIFSEAGDDTIKIYTQGDNVVVHAAAGNDEIDVYGMTGLIDAAEGDDSIIAGFDGSGSIDAGCGHDDIFAVGGVLVDAGSGDDLIFFEDWTESGVVFAGSGNDVIFADSFFVPDSKNLIYGEEGNDIIVSGVSDDTIYAGSGKNVINLKGDSVVLTEFLAESFGSEITVEGGGNDTVYLENGQDIVILGASGFATIYGFSGNDRLDLTGLNASFTQVGGDTLIMSDGVSLGVLVGYTGSVGLV